MTSASVSSGTVTTSPGDPVPSRQRTAYWVALGLFTVMFAYSAIWSIVDPSGTKVQTAKLGYPGYLAVYPLASAKLAGLVVIHLRRFRTLSHFAFAGFLFDLLLALAGHIHTRDFPYGWLSVLGLAFWAAAFRMDAKRAAGTA
jgi:DoxX-like family